MDWFSTSKFVYIAGRNPLDDDGRASVRGGADAARGGPQGRLPRPRRQDPTQAGQCAGQGTVTAVGAISNGVLNFLNKISYIVSL